MKNSTEQRNIWLFKENVGGVVLDEY